MTTETGKWVKKSGHWHFEPPKGAVSAFDLAVLDEPAPETGDYWGDWVYHAERETLTFKPESTQSEYEVRLDELKEAKDVIDWVNQLHSKAWMNPKALGDFIYALFGLKILPTDDTFRRNT